MTDLNLKPIGNPSDEDYEIQKKFNAHANDPAAHLGASLDLDPTLAAGLNSTVPSSGVVKTYVGNAPVSTAQAAALAAMYGVSERNLDGGVATAIYGGIDSFDCGNAASIYGGINPIDCGGA
jgi:hypothetical protein